MPRREDQVLITVPVTEDERQSVHDMAEAAGMSTNNYIRELLGLELLEAGGSRSGAGRPVNSQKKIAKAQNNS